jgi:phage gp29-like protein
MNSNDLSKITDYIDKEVQAVYQKTLAIAKSDDERITRFYEVGKREALLEFKAWLKYEANFSSNENENETESCETCSELLEALATFDNLVDEGFLQIGRRYQVIEYERMQKARDVTKKYTRFKEAPKKLNPLY